MFQHLLVGLLLHREYGFTPSRVERLYFVILQFDLPNLIQVQDGLVHVADLEILVDHPCDLPSHEKAFLFVRSFFLNKDSHLDVSVLLETARFLSQELRILSAILLQ